MTILKASISKPMEGGPSFSLQHRLYRAVWNTVWWLLAAWTPAPFHSWRGWLLRRFGARIHNTARVYGGARIWYPPNLTMGAYSVVGPNAIIYSQDHITIDSAAVISQGAHLCTGTHDITDPDFQLVTKPIQIGAGAWVAAECFIGPGVAIGEGAVIGARSVLFHDAEPYGVYIGNPAAIIKKRLFRARR